MKRILYTLYLLSIATLSFTKSEVTINVWVHGTYPVMSLLGHNYSPFRSWIYAPKGLSLAKELPYHYHFRRLAHECHARDSVGYNLDHFYLYGWHSSTISPKKRRSEGRKLYRAVSNLINEYRKKYIRVKLRLIGVSHGGNVVMHCLKHLPIDANIETDVILLGTPIQESNRQFVNTDHVHRVYSFYSNSDWMQRIDIQRLHSDAPTGAPFWSSRTFSESDNVIQVCLKIDGKSISHGYYRSIIKYLPEMLQRVDCIVEEHKKQAHIVLDFKKP